MLVSAATFVALMLLLRRSKVSLGLPIAYLFLLLLIHLPGAWAQSVSGGLLQGYYYTELGMRITAVAAVCFLVGVFLALSRRNPDTGIAPAERSSFALFCLVAGWTFTFGLSFLNSIASLGAAVHEAGAIWIIGIVIGLGDGLRRRSLTAVGFWLGALAVYPMVTLIHAGFLSYGASAVILAVSSLAIVTRRFWRLALAAAAILVVGLSAFVTYFEGRTEIRHSVWGGESLGERVATIADVASRAHVINPGSLDDLGALNARLNQNYFVGMAADRLDGGVSDYLHGKSLRDGFAAMIPRIASANKQVVAGSGAMVAEATGLDLDTGTSWGVGNVMELFINFGWPGIIIGFAVLGFTIAVLDRRAALAGNRGDFGGLLLFFLPCIALIQPGGSFVEMTSGAAAALIAAIAWRMAWFYWVGRRKLARPATVHAIETR
jgi:hypothetical protein